MNSSYDTQRIRPPAPPQTRRGSSTHSESATSDPRAWLDALPSGLPVVPPFGRGASYTVEIGAEIKRGEGWHILGVDIHRKDLDATESKSVVGTLTPQQARALARALEAGADEAELRSHIPDDEDDQ